MKRTIKSSIVAFGFLLILNSCSSFLEESPTDRLVVDNFYTTADDAQAGVDATYQQLNALYNRLMYMLGELPTDNMKNGLGMPNTFLQDMEFLRYNSQNTFIRDMWANCYAGISKANAAVNNIPNITMNTTLQNRLVAEAMFLRALYYFNLVRYFGDVPLVTDVKTISDALGPRTPKDQVYALIIDDLTFAEEFLPLWSEYSAADEGRVTKGAAKILLGKVYLAMHDFASATEKLAEVIDNEGTYGYGLHDNYGDNWKPGTESGIEAVLYLEFKEPPYTANGEMGLAGPKYSVPGGNIGVTGSNEADIPTQELFDQFDPNDLRRAVNFRFDFTNPKTGQVLTSSIPLSGKYWIDGLDAANKCDINMHIIRYADALLMYAEALNEVDRTAEAITVLNRVRERGFGNTSGNYGAVSKDEFRTIVLNERRLEFPHEGHRWFDLARTGTFIQRMIEHSAYEASVAESNKTVLAENIKDHMILMPIPQREIDLNPQLVQNPGW